MGTSGTLTPAWGNLPHDTIVRQWREGSFIRSLCFSISYFTFFPFIKKAEFLYVCIENFMIMNAIRQFVEVKDHSFNVSLPKDFNAKSVEIIIIPNEDFPLISEQQKKILEKALQQDKKSFISRDELTRKHKL